ncbi:lipopolysaccharide biosynthesis protein [Mobilitalea sibirica]|uniref:Lipopolysaccharide biosynthesis protein n=1 Tax=Mobilitalea sibirica TaxID=1462919 RepID=A0A8J7H618_9FIRM|nr:lipopolysaccharide biosynthesis protein [Mobilitalea sibirica]MBH1942059.1 lipopolysaccharide biosynthesis protein [Mobilitalea sibirica]
MEDKSLAKSFIYNLIGFSIPVWIQFFLSFISAPITTRLFIPAEMGKINLFSTYLSMFILIALLGLDQSFVRYYNEPPSKNDMNSLNKICMLITLFSSTFIGGFILLFWNKISLMITDAVSLLVPICLIISLYANIFLRFFGLFFRMQGNVFIYSLQAIAITVVSKILFIIVALWNPNHINAIIAITLGYVIIMVTFLIYQNHKVKRNTLYLDDETIKALFKYGLPLLPITVLSWLNNSLGQLMLNKYIDFAAIGIYSNAVAVASIISLLQAGFNTYWAPFVYKGYKTQALKIQKIHNIITFGMILFGLMIILGQDVIYLLIGENFRSSKIFFPLLLVTPICYTIAETTGLGIAISKKSYLNIITFLGNVTVNILLCIILLPTIGIMGAAIAAASAGIIMLILKTVIGERYYKCITSYRKTFSSVIIFIIAAICNIIFFNNPLQKYISILFLACILIFIYRNEVLYMIRIIKEIFKDFFNNRKD